MIFDLSMMPEQIPALLIKQTNLGIRTNFYLIKTHWYKYKANEAELLKEFRINKLEKDSL